MTEFSVARNAKTTLYEVHKDGCAHLKLGKFDFVSKTSAATANAAASEFEANNDGCFSKLAPCTTGGR